MTTITGEALNVPQAQPPAAASLLLRLLREIRQGDLQLATPDGALHRFGPGAHIGSAGSGQLALHDWRVCREALTGGDVAFADAYVDGRWDSPDLVALLTFIACNQSALESAFYGRWWQQCLFRLRHLLRANTRTQAKRNIAAHYDLGNAFYQLWLDPTMTYSSALFNGNLAQSLAQAQEAKYERMLQQLDPAPGDHLLEIGCGWGGFAEYAARTRNVRVTGISLSAAQTEYARARIARAGLSDRVQLELRDYRDVRDTYDGIVSVEMFEAVGERWWNTYFRALREALKPGGRAVIQTITIADARFERYRANSDFIQQYIFPGGMLSSPAQFARHAVGGGFDVLDSYTFGLDYAETLKRWLAAFETQTEAVIALGFDARFLRLWRFYLAYCTAGFTSRTTDVAHYTLRRSACGG
jgi:cyclopropane-fatty-acyl-phospholipid synthase